MNPPYQSKSDRSNTKTQAIWDKFVKLSIDLLNPEGFLAAIHPSKWRKPDDKTGIPIRSKNLIYLETHNEKDGMKTFGAETRYDWYLLKNEDYQGSTIILDQDGIQETYDISNMNFIPNAEIDIIFNLLAKQGEASVHLVSGCFHHTQRTEYMSPDKTKEFCYPCIYVVNAKGQLKLWYSSKPIYGEFLQPKLVFSNGRISSANYFIDETGEYGLTQFSRGIVDTPDNLKLIYAAMRSDKFKHLMESCSMSLLQIDKDVMKTFRKDFWKEFEV